MPQFFIKPENITDNEIFITNRSDVNHITRVLRLRKKDSLMLAGPENLVYIGEITEISENFVKAAIVDRYISNRKLSINITLAQSILKSGGQDIVIQKATELGANEIIPLITRNTVVKISSDVDKFHKLKRWQKIAYEASKQCQRNGIPEIRQIIDVNELFEMNNFDLILACVEAHSQYSIKDYLSKHAIKKPEDILIIIGPEGGWDSREFDLFKSRNIPLVSLGNLILRAETAAMNAISDIIYEYEL